MPLIPKETSESSTLFSLRELMTLEQKRVNDEERSAATKREVEKQAALAASQRAREKEQARLDSERAAREAAKRRENEERARLEGIRQAELARTQAELETRRLEREHELRTAEAAAQREHEQLLTRMNADARYRRLTLLAFGMATLFAIAGVTTGALWHQATAAWQTERGELNEALTLAFAKLENRDRAISNLNRRVTVLESDKRQLKLERDEARESARNPPKPPKPAPVVKATPTREAVPAPPCFVGDPMNPCLDIGD